MRSVRVLVYSAALFILAVQPSSAQEVGACYPDLYCAGANVDRLGLGPSPTGLKEEPTYWHSSCLYCSTGDCHDDCVPNEEEEDVQKAYLEVLAAIERQDYGAVVRSAPAVASYLVWNTARRSVQLLACDGQFIAASLVVDDPVIAETVAELVQDQ